MKKDETKRKKGQPLKDPVRERYAGQRAMGLSQDAAFRKAMPQAKNRSVKSVSVTATRMEHEPEVQERISEITADLLHSSDAYLTKAKLAELLSDAIRNTITDERLVSSSAGLIDKYCKMFGFYEPEKVDARVGCLDAGARDAKITRLIGLAAKSR